MFTPDDRKRLKLFCKISDGIASCRFIVDFPKQSHHICVGTLPDGQVVNEYPKYDDDDLRAFWTHYRKLRLEQEPSNLFAIMKLLQWKGDPNDRVLYDSFKHEIKEEGRCWWGAVLRDRNGGKTLLTQEGFEDLILNGEVFHSEPEKSDDLTRLIGDAALPKAVAFFNYMRFARTVVGSARRTADLIRLRGYLVEQG
jgi:hypothetical protein